MEPIATFDVVAFDARDPHALAAFYGDILGWQIDPEETDERWVQLRSETGATLAFQYAPEHVAPAWPSASEHLQAHLDFYVDDLDAAEQRAIALGAVKTEVQPNPMSFRVYLDPAGHPFCLVRRRE